jgi:predicted nucleic-acid-binding protein
LELSLDTNVLVRYLLNDYVKQSSRAKDKIRQAVKQGVLVRISLLTILETEWVLRSYGKCDKATVIDTMKCLLESRDVQIEQEETLEQALHYYGNHNADFADCLMVSRYQRTGCEVMITFDEKASRLPSVELLSTKSSDSRR